MPLFVLDGCGVYWANWKESIATTSSIVDGRLSVGTLSSRINLQTDFPEWVVVSVTDRYSLDGFVDMMI